MISYLQRVDGKTGKKEGMETGSKGKGVTKESPVGREAQLVVTFSNVYMVEGHLLISP